MKEIFIVVLLTVIVLTGGYLFKRFIKLTRTSQSFVSWRKGDEGMKSVIDHYKDALLTRNIPLFLSTFSPDYPDPLGKKKEVEDFLKKYKFLDFQYELLPNYPRTLKNNQVEIEVKWTIRLRQLNDNKIISAVETNLFRFQKTQGEWKIMEVRILP
jgi:hypothetical protein